jgi:hypothetical protein
MLTRCSLFSFSLFLLFPDSFSSLLVVQTRNVNTRQHLGELPSFVSPILERISLFPNLDNHANIVLDQLTVCGNVILYIKCL